MPGRIPVICQMVRLIYGQAFLVSSQHRDGSTPARHPPPPGGLRKLTLEVLPQLLLSTTHYFANYSIIAHAAKTPYYRPQLASPVLSLIFFSLSFSLAILSLRMRVLIALSMDIPVCILQQIKTFFLHPSVINVTRRNVVTACRKKQASILEACLCGCVVVVVGHFTTLRCKRYSANIYTFKQRLKF